METSVVTLAVRIVSSAYAILGSGLGACLFVAATTPSAAWFGMSATLTLLGLVALACAVAVVAGAVLRRSHPLLGAGSLMVGALGISAGIGLFATSLATYGGTSRDGWIVGWVVATLIAACPALLTGIAVIRRREQRLKEALS